jgi:4-amino-4-deoxy-L-arabinose transferase-like glycosyltransferase
MVGPPSEVGVPSAGARSAFGRRGFDVDRTGLAIFLILAECLFLFFYGLSAGELYRNETLRAILAAGFLRSGNWAVPTLYGEPLFTKPPGMYAAIALASLPAGRVTEFSARFPSALSGTLTVLLFFWYFRRHFGNRGALVAAAILPISFMWLDKSTAAEIDMMQTAWVSAAIIFFLRAVECQEDSTAPMTLVSNACISGVGSLEAASSTSQARPQLRKIWAWGWWIAALFCVAAGVLTKWTSPAFFYAMAIPFLWRTGRLRLLFGVGHLAGAAVATLICMGWICLAVHRTDWHAWHDTVTREAMIRLLPSYHPKPYPWGETLLHPIKILAMNLPWSLLALYTLVPTFATLWDFKQQRVLLGFHCWLWPNLVFWSIIPEHGFRHSFPLFGAISGLAGMVCVAWLEGKVRAPRSDILHGAPKPRIRPAPTIAGILAIWLLIKLAYVHIVIPSRNEFRQPREKGALVAALVPQGEPLYLFALKDEGLMFYYGGAVMRLAGPDKLPSSTMPVYCILDEREWTAWRYPERTTVVQPLRDAQNDPIFLVRVYPPLSLGP